MEKKETQQPKPQRSVPRCSSGLELARAVVDHITQRCGKPFTHGVFEENTSSAVCDTCLCVDRVWLYSIADALWPVFLCSG